MISTNLKLIQWNLNIDLDTTFRMWSHKQYFCTKNHLKHESKITTELLVFETYSRMFSNNPIVEIFLQLSWKGRQTELNVNYIL